jgi:hypothetical protein
MPGYSDKGLADGVDHAGDETGLQLVAVVVL